MNGKKSCKYYDVCGNLENCLRCKGYAKKEEQEEIRDISEDIKYILGIIQV